MPCISSRIGTGVAILAVSAMLSTTALARAGSRFETADTDHDGRVTLQEFETFTGQRLILGNGKAAQKFRQLNPEQQAHRLQARFNRLDQGHKGYLVPTDWPARR